MENKKRVLVYGDIFTDKYTFVETSRIAPEANTPVWDFVKDEIRLGGAANVANNIKALLNDEVDITLAGITSSSLIDNIFSISKFLGICSESIEKHRFIENSSKKILMRVDNQKYFSQTDSEVFNEYLISSLEDLEPFDAVVVSDYDKGTVSSKTIDVLKNNSLTIVDSKRKDLSMFKGFKILKLNELEFSSQVSSKKYTCVERLFDYCVVTKGKNGAELRQAENVSDSSSYVVHSESFFVDSVDSVDVTGCGDTHTAAMTVALLKNKNVRAAMRFANKCASKVVQKFGTSVVHDCNNVI
jgi:rfaE bifunctional protein kinase chain/domain